MPIRACLPVLHCTQSRKDVEGSLFLAKRRVQPRFQFIILNKKSAGACLAPTKHLPLEGPRRCCWRVLLWPLCMCSPPHEAARAAGALT